MSSSKLTNKEEQPCGKPKRSQLQKLLELGHYFCLDGSHQLGAGTTEAGCHKQHRESCAHRAGGAKFWGAFGTALVQG